MLTLEKYPPYLYLHQVADHVPEASKTFLYLWRERDEHFRVFVTREDIIGRAFFSWTKFLNDLRKLAGNDLLEYTQVDGVTVITLAAPSEEMQEWLP
jgi:hypothetical protein